MSGCGCSNQVSTCGCGGCNSCGQGCCSSCCESSQSYSQTHVSRVTNINYNMGSNPVGVRQLCAPNHCGCGCGSYNGCSCHANVVCTAVCLDPTLFCIETINDVKQITINAGVKGTILANVNGTLYQVQAGDIIKVTQSVTAGVCDLPVVLINDTAAQVAQLFTDVINTPECDCVKVEFTNTQDSVDCVTSVQLYVVPE